MNLLHFELDIGEAFARQQAPKSLQSNQTKRCRHCLRSCFASGYGLECASRGGRQIHHQCQAIRSVEAGPEKALQVIRDAAPDVVLLQESYQTLKGDLVGSESSHNQWQDQPMWLANGELVLLDLEASFWRAVAMLVLLRGDKIMFLR